ncbi:MAG TPA: hypothetical protein VLG50_04830 [Candidatus Saccharimonadales bacterium]|nr:hypothetical protein [Candidatus Saccharimonadales bacterium]
MFEIIYICKIGILAGIIVSMVGTILGMSKFTTLNFGPYSGCLLTGRPSGTFSFIAGITFHIFVSAALALVYVFFIGLFHVELTFINSLIAGCIHTILSAILMTQLNYVNPCVRNKILPPLKYFASNHGVNGIITFVITHTLYAVILFWMLRY